MNTIVYTSNTGTTKEYAKLLSDKLSLPYYSLDEIEYKVKPGSKIIYLGWIMASGVKGYRKISIDKIRIYTEVQFKHWTEEEFPSLFRRMLTLEQYRNQEMADLYQKYLVSGPIEYMTYLFAGITGKKEEAKQLATEFYGPIFLMYSLYDNKREEDDLAEMLKKHVDRFSKKMDSY